MNNRVRVASFTLMGLALTVLVACTALPPAIPGSGVATSTPFTPDTGADTATPAARPAATATAAPGELAAQAVQVTLADQLGVAATDVAIVSVEPAEWPDTCLGAAAPDEMCAQVVVPGYKIILEAGGQTYVYHTDATGSQFRLVASPEAEAACPASTEELQALLNSDHGYCLAYPAEYKVEKPNPNSTMLVIGGLLDASNPRLEIRVEDWTGTKAEAIADEMQTEYPGFAIERSTATVGGEPAVVLDKLPGQDITRRVLFVHDGRQYVLDFAPADPSVDAFAGMVALYAAVLGSFTFVPPSEQADGDQLVVNDCLSPTSKTQLLTDAVRGFCLLYPAGYSAWAPSPNEVMLYAGSLQDVSRPKLFVQVEDAGGRTAEQIADGLVADAQAAVPGIEIERPFGVTLGYEPAALLDGMPGQELSRQAIAVHGGRVYELIFVPADESQAEVYHEMQALYDLAVRSFRFLP
jgi:hypothetical protein